MVLSVIPPTEASVLVDVATSPLDRVLRRSRDAHLGRGLLVPFRRGDRTDFANAEGEALVRARVGQILGMRGSSEVTVGELPWAPERGSLLYRLRHVNNDLLLRELGRVYVADALRRWEPCVRLKSVRVQRFSPTVEGLNTLVIRLVYDVVRESSGANEVYLAGVDQTVETRT